MVVHIFQSDEQYLWNPFLGGGWQFTPLFAEVEIFFLLLIRRNYIKRGETNEAGKVVGCEKSCLLLQGCLLTPKCISHFNFRDLGTSILPCWSESKFCPGLHQCCKFTLTPLHLPRPGKHALGTCWSSCTAVTLQQQCHALAASKGWCLSKHHIAVVQGIAAPWKPHDCQCRGAEAPHM